MAQCMVKEVYLADGDSPDNWYEITDAEYTTFETAEQEKNQPRNR